MEVIDKRKKSKNDDWKVGDVICFGSYDHNFRYLEMIVQEPISDRYSVVSLNTGDEYFSNHQYKEINEMIESLKLVWDYVEKVNAYLVVEEK